MVASEKQEPVHSVIVVGGGIGGMQAALDLAESGFKIYLIEKNPSIGGTMAQLDKTFPTNDCSMCILSPKMVDVSRHQNIELLTNSEIEKIDGFAGNFKVTVRKKARYINDKCVGCGLCAEKCVLKNKFPNEFDEGLRKRGAIYIPFPQAVPLKYIVDKEQCLFLKHGKCAQSCIKACNANAIDFEQKDEEIKLNAGAIIFAQGFEEFDAGKKYQYGYGRYKNVVISIEAERMMCASGPSNGIVLRPSDNKSPKKIGFIQCVGSRDKENEYCSSVCCMYSTKEAMIIKEHQDAECDVFYIDMRAYGKDFEQYIERAKNMNIKYHRCMPSIEEVRDSKNLILTYEAEDGKIEQSVFDMIVLAVGLCPPKDSKKIADVSGIELNNYGFCRTIETAPVEAGREGIYVCGAFSGPKDIPETVMQASAAASKAKTLLSGSKINFVEEKKHPSEKETGSEPRIGVFVCHCGINIGGVVNVPDVMNYAKTLPNVVYSSENTYSCSQDTQKKIKDAIENYNLNRVVVAACSPRTHEPLFRETLVESGLNQYLFEMANIRDHCSWVHSHEPVKATEKAKDLVKMAVAKVNLAVPLKITTSEVIRSALVIGGGVSGMTAALEIANQGYDVSLIERDSELGGNLKNVHYTLTDQDISKFLNNLIAQVTNNDLIKIYTNTEIKSVEGYVGDFTVNTENSCGIFNLKKTTSFFNTINLNNTNKDTLKGGVIIVATGAQEYEPREFMYGTNSGILTQSEFEEKLSKKEVNAKRIAMIQCVGSRNDEKPYCSRICCNVAIKNALKVKEQNPDTEIFVLYKDIRTYGFNEKFYKEAREKGIIFIGHEKDKQPNVSVEGGKIYVEVEDRYLHANIKIDVDFLVLSSAIIPRADTHNLSEMLKVPLTQNGFFLEAHMKLRPVDFATEGIFICGMAHSPKLLSESISQSLAAAGRASILLTKGIVQTEAVSSEIDSEKCIACGNCIVICPYNALRMNRDNEKHFVESNPLLCKGCGACSVVCPVKAITMKNFTDIQINSMIRAALETIPEDEPKIIGFVCNWCSYAGADNAGVSRFQYPPNIRLIRVMCSGRIEPEFIYNALLLGADGVLIGGCHINDCHYISGNVHAEKRIKGRNSIKDYVKDAGLDEKRVRLEWVSAAEGQRFADVIRKFTEELKNLGPNPLKLKLKS
ncbi:MAG: hypothetical protein BWK75_01530 [Candidatus Altiarchaeales archaeon A3]|nr:MAG: hypothetical protein BWK75_01530 [Candidatus Altiarchaeales archaeon A3]